MIALPRRSTHRNIWIHSILCLGLGAALATPTTRALLGQVTSVHPSDTTQRQRFRNPQVLPEAKDDWIESQGLQRTFLAVRARIDSVSPEIDEDWRDHVAQQIAALYRMDEISRLRTRGIDVIRAHLGRPTPTETTDDFVDRTDVMVIGEVIDVDSSAYDNDEYASTVTVLIHEVLKGDTTLDTIRVRQYSGKFGRMARGSTADFDPIRHTRHLFQVSHRLYPLYTIARGGTPLSGKPLYVLQTAPREINNDERLEHPKACLVPVSAMHSLKEIRASVARYRE